MNVKTAFLNGELEDEIYMEQLEGFVVLGKENKICIARSTMESEFIALDKAGKEAERFQNFLEDIPYWPKPVTPVCIHCDSQATIGRTESMMYNDWRSQELGSRRSNKVVSDRFNIVNYPTHSHDVDNDSAHPNILWELTSSSSHALQIPREDTPLLTDTRHLSSSFKTFTNVFIAVVVAGVLGLPYSFKKIGWLMGTVMLLLVASLTYHCVGMILPLEAEMKDKDKFGKILGLYMAFISLMYGSFGVLGYFSFGEETKDIITTNLGRGLFSTLVQIGLCINLFLTFPLMMNHVYEVIERRFCKGRYCFWLRWVGCGFGSHFSGIDGARRHVELLVFESHIGVGCDLRTEFTKHLVSNIVLHHTRLREYKLYVKMEKCESTHNEVKFLGHLVSKNQVRMDSKKVQAIMEWQTMLLGLFKNVDGWRTPSGAKDLRSFLGLANYYHKFIASYSKKKAVLTDLLGKDVKWEWSERCDAAFQTLKEAIALECILKLTNFELPLKCILMHLTKLLGCVGIRRSSGGFSKSGTK
ncbi:putative SRSF protein kinase 1-like [Capsicum annuum]|nr:putative SRSF protein kinase 1-like [Capsicum annuum]